MHVNEIISGSAERRRRVRAHRRQPRAREPASVIRWHWMSDVRAG